MFRIYISYREEDADGYAGWLYKRLCDHFGPHQVFRDVESIPAGENKEKFTEMALSTCDVVIAVIGDEWINVTDEHGELKLRKGSDKVRREISQAMQSRKRVIPALINRVSLPGKEALPESLDHLADIKPIHINEHDFDHSVNQLIIILEAQLQSSPGRYAVFERVKPKHTLFSGEKVSISVTILIVSIGWAFGWEIISLLIFNSQGSFSRIIQNLLPALPIPASFLIGGIFAGMLIGIGLGIGFRPFMQISDWKFVTFISLGWMILLSLSLYLSQIIVSSGLTLIIISIFMGGIVTGLIIRSVEKHFQWWQVLIVGLIVMSCFLIVGFGSFIVYGKVPNPTFFEWIIVSTIGNGLILWQIKYAQENYPQ